MKDKQKIIDGVDVSKCEAIDNNSGWCSFWEENCTKNPDCIHKKYYRKEQSEEKLVKQIQTICDFINNRPGIFKGVNGSVDKIITDYAKAKEQECENYKQLAAKHCTETINMQREIDQLKTECERLKKKLNPKLKNAHCAYFEGQTGLCKTKEFTKCNPVNCKLYTIDELSTIVDLQQQLDQLKAENEYWKERVISGNEKIEELRFSVSDLTNRLCNLNAEKSFRIVDLEQTLTEIKNIVKKCIKTNDSTYNSSIQVTARAILSEEILKKISECEVMNE